MTPRQLAHLGLGGVLAWLLCGRVAAQSTHFDVPKSHWARPAIDDLVKRGFLPPETHFDGEGYLTRAQMAVVVERVLNYVNRPDPRRERIVELSDTMRELLSELRSLRTRAEALEADLSRTTRQVRALGFLGDANGSRGPK